MPSNWLAIDTDFPSFTGEETPGQQIQALHNYLFQLREGLQYSLQNLTEKNFNAAALQSLTDAQKNEVTAQLQKVYDLLNQTTTKIDSLGNRVSGIESLSGRVGVTEKEITDLKDRAALSEENVEGLADWVTEIQGAADGLQRATENINTAIETIRSDVTINRGNVTELTEDLQTLRQNQEKITGAVQVAEDGSAVVGTEGKPLHLVGEIYINGVLIGQGGTE